VLIKFVNREALMIVAHPAFHYVQIYKII